MIFLIISTIIWALSFSIIGNYLSYTIDPWSLSLLRLIISFLIFLPFLVIDLVIASILMALGMMMLSPMIISLPFKLLLFVLVDGWAVMIGSLAATYVM